MERVPVSSSNLVSVGYDIDTMTLEVEFNSGIYQYYDVPEYVYDELMGAPSLGSYLHHNIKSSYLCARV
ncbi:KTSC domain-containing protein [Vibrio parahaemolyticus]|uniref:KTSC domain-containing protein n=1 Tax=Vibrio TaxID=662 RepID=UPI0009AA8525|nr:MULTISPECIES: KTSC domain-containing protein [Vibrio]EGQ9502548.1 KTSC domain-containing protein [Vibrio cholerae]ELG4787514.1 KTSC domain-containing protein [Vibrio vulnificus]EJL6445455.1 KTSC domain-containing protein [Vibrio cholerae]EKD9024448.1 KTSC domain-containing protein [Vibrio parahaemolyticus]NAW70391.1 KTSC domain-containing protein [Vibrio sp. V28_P6S34P95]